MALRLCARASLSLAGRPLGAGAAAPRWGSVGLTAPLFHGPQRRSFSEIRDIKVPTIEVAKELPKSVQELSNESLFILAEQGCHDSCRERLVRNIMDVDNVEWLAAQDMMKKVDEENSKGIGLVTLPYKVGISAGLFTGIASIPMVFHLPTVMWFNEAYVTSDVPEEKDLETWLEVGSWAWNWMEPPLGTASFVLLALQYVRSQMLNMDLRPYTSWVKERRAAKLAAAFPQYNEQIVRAFALTAALR